MKTMKQYIWAMGVALTAIALTACSSEDELAQTETPVKQDNVVTLTATVLPKTSNGLRGLTDPNDGTLTAEWAEGEEFLVHYIKSGEPVDGYAMGTITSVDDNGNATITVDLTSPKEGDSQIDFYYPYSSANGEVDAYTDQVGTLADVSANYDQSMGSGTLTVNSGTPTLPDGVAMQRINCVWKFTFTDGTNNITNQITKLEINDGTGGGVPYTITPTGALSTFYVSLYTYGVENTTITITAYTATGMYRKVKSGITLENGKLYTSSGLALKKVNLGDLFGADGNVYANAAAVTAAGTTAIGVVAYLDQADTEDDDAITEKNYGGGHGLVLCLKNAASGVMWSQLVTDVEFSGEEVQDVAGLKRTENVSGYTNTATLVAKASAESNYPAAYQAANYTGLAAPASCTTGWFLPSAQQWVRMQTGLGSVSENDITWIAWFDNTHSGASNWNTALEKAGAGKYDSMLTNANYWSSSENGIPLAIILMLDMDANKGFNWTPVMKSETASNIVRPVLAF